MTLFGFELTFRRKATPPLRPLAGGMWGSGGGWFPVVREPFTGAWQQNQDISAQTALAYGAVFACQTLIANDLAKLRMRLVAQDRNGIWTETESAAFSPVLRIPNRYQTWNKFCRQWVLSKLRTGNTYVLKARDARGVVVALYVLEPSRVRPLVAPDGAVYYQIDRHDLAGQPDASIVAPAREVIHDTMNELFHPLIGMSPIFACGLAALQGQSIQQYATTSFQNGAQPGGVLIVPGTIKQEQADALKTTWETKFGGNNAGKLALLSDGMTYEQLEPITAVDAQMIQQLDWTGINVCSAHHVPPFMIDIGPFPPYANSEPVLQKYYAQCLQSQISDIETSLDTGLELPKPYGTEFDIDDLIWMDTATRSKAASDGISGGVLSPNEARKRYYNLGPVEGGDSPMVQQQYFSLEALAQRDAEDPFSKPTPAPPAVPPDADDDTDDEADEAAFVTALHRTLEGIRHAA